MSGPLVLIVEDEPDLAYGLRHELHERGYQAQTALNGLEALGVLQTTQPAAVILDLKLPGMSGVELVQRIKRLRPQTQILVVTGHSVDYGLFVGQLGVAEVLQKPITLETILASLGRFVPLDDEE